MWLVQLDVEWFLMTPPSCLLLTSYSTLLDVGEPGEGLEDVGTGLSV